MFLVTLRRLCGSPKVNQVMRLIRLTLASMDKIHQKVAEVVQKKKNECQNSNIITQGARSHQFKLPESDNNIGDMSRKTFAPKSKLKNCMGFEIIHEWRHYRI